MATDLVANKISGSGSCLIGKLQNSLCNRGLNCWKENRKENCCCYALKLQVLCLMQSCPGHREM